MAVKEATDQKAWNSGQVSADQVKALLEGFKDEVVGDVARQLNDLRTSLPSQEETTIDWQAGAKQDRAVTNDTGCLYTYRGRQYDVPANFDFPKKVKFTQGLELWLKGQSNCVDNSTFVRPYRNIRPFMLPTKKLKDVFKLSWRALFSIFEDNVFRDLPQDTRSLSTVEMTRYQALCMEQLKGMVSYCFTAQKKPHSWSVSTWAVRTRRSSIEKNGTAQDKALLPPATFRNKPNRTMVRTRQGQSQLAVLYPHRQARRLEGVDVMGNEGDDGSEEDESSNVEI